MLGYGVKFVAFEPMGVGQRRVVGFIGQLICWATLQLQPSPLDRAATVLGDPDNAGVITKGQQRREAGTALQLLLNRYPLGRILHPQTGQGVSGLQLEAHAAAASLAASGASTMLIGSGRVPDGCCPTAGA